MNAGAPTVMSDVNDLGRLVTEPGAGLSIPPGDVNALLEAIDTILKADEKQITHWSANGKEASKPYLWSTITEDLLQIYRRVKK
jgi:glycosyltransferase involved in cell wall biosynthesis